jgi:uronate dehydrogenase
MSARILITGAAGTIGMVLRDGLRGRYSLIRCADITPQVPARDAGEEIVSLDICDPDSLYRAMAGIDCVVHLAGVPQEADWPTVLALNIDGAYNTFEAARQRGVKRMIFASSNHAIGFHRTERVLDDAVAPRPDSRYGASKVFGEALGRLYADKHGMSVACLRIGTFRTPDRPTAVRHLSTWISHRDMVQLVERCIEAPSYHFVVAYGVSANRRSRWNNANVAFLGYRPQDDAEEFAAELGADDPAQISDPDLEFHGGSFCLEEFDGDRSRID